MVAVWLISGDRAVGIIITMANWVRMEAPPLREARSTTMTGAAGEEGVPVGSGGAPKRWLSTRWREQGMPLEPGQWRGMEVVLAELVLVEVVLAKGVAGPEEEHEAAFGAVRKVVERLGG